MPRRKLSSWMPGYRGELTKREYETALTLKSVYSIEMAKHKRMWEGDDSRSLPTWKDELDLLQPGIDDDDSSDEAGEVLMARRTKKRRHPDQLWIDLAKRVMKEGIEPYPFIRMQFVASNLEGGRPGSAPSPNALNTAAAIRNYERGTESTLQEIATAWTFQMKEFERYVSCSPYRGEDAWMSALFDDAAQLSALFRYCLAFDVAVNADSIAKRERFAKVCREYRADAAEQYLENPAAYDRVWGEGKIPNKFRKQAADIYRLRYARKATR